MRLTKNKELNLQVGGLNENIESLKSEKDDMVSKHTELKKQLDLKVFALKLTFR